MQICEDRLRIQREIPEISRGTIYFTSIFSKKDRQKQCGGFNECSSFSLQEKQDESAKMEDSQNWLTPLPLPDEKETPKKYWPCAPDGYIPNSVIRKFIKPKPFPDHERLISRHKRHVTSNAKVKEEEDEETDEDLRITGETVSMLTLSVAYSPRTFSRC